MNYGVPTGVQLNEAQMYAAVDSDVPTKTCKQYGGLTIICGLCSLFLDVRGDWFFFSFFLKEPGGKMDSDSIYDQHKMTALMFDRKTRYKS